MMVNRRILTPLLTTSCLTHIYISLQHTYRIETKSSPGEIYVHQRGPFCKQHTACFSEKSPGALFVFPTLIQSEWDKRRAPPPLQGGTDKERGGDK